MLRYQAGHSTSSETNARRPRSLLEFGLSRQSLLFGRSIRGFMLPHGPVGRVAAEETPLEHVKQMSLETGAESSQPGPDLSEWHRSCFRLRNTNVLPRNGPKLKKVKQQPQLQHFPP